MFSLSIQIINLVFHEPQKHKLQQQIVTIRFGPLQSDIRLTGQNSNSGGKRLMLQMQQSQLYNLFSTYAFGLFIKNQLGKFWCILNIAQIKINQKYSCHDLIFYDDDRKNCYTFQLQLQLLNFNPALPKRTNKPSQPLANTTPNAVHSFLNNTNQNLNANHRKNNQQQTNKKKFIKNKNQPKKDQNKINYGVIQHKNINNFVNQEDSGIYIPPVMQFLNQSNEASIIQSKQRQFNTKQDKFTPHNIIKQQMPKLKTFVNYSQFKQQNSQKSKAKMQSKQIKRNELRQMAIKQAQKQMNKKSNQIMIPMPNPNTGTYELIPLSNMTEAQIIQYAQKQRKAQQYQKFKQQQLIKLKQKEEKKRKKQLTNQFKKKIPNQIAKQNIGPKQKISHRQNISEKYKESSSEIQSSQSVIQMQDDKQQNSYEADEQVYESDFQSVSNAGSQLKSRLSLQSSRSMSQQKKKNNYQDASESLDEYGYSQDFDSFSQSLLSKNKKAVNSISEISQSYLSMSNRK